jgi:hypothetical protein
MQTKKTAARRLKGAAAPRFPEGVVEKSRGALVSIG